jgi:hypothetical protein
MEEVGRVLGLRRCPQTEKFAADGHDSEREELPFS